MSEEHFDMSKWTDRIDAVAAPKVGFTPDKWHAWIYEVADQGGMYVTGAVCPPKTRGPRKGEPNYRKHDRATKRVVYLTPDECK